MSRIQEIAEELVNLSIQEVNELSQIMKNEYGIEQYAYKVENYKSCKTTSPKEYGQSLNRTKKF